MKFKVIIVFFLFVCFGFAQNNQKINGKIVDKTTNQGVGFASVSLKGTKYRIDTNENGEFVLDVKPGKYLMVVNFIGYFTATKEIVVSAEDLTVTVELEESSSKIDQVVVKKTLVKTTETALLQEQQKAVEIKQSIGAQEMSRKGISNIEQGLTKITGITKVGSRGIFVRGLEDRYNNLLVNDLALPSNNPFKKIVSLDMFSTDIVGVIDVYKTFNPNISGDFAGATFNVTTLTSAKSSTKVNIGVGYTTGNNLQQFLLSKSADNANGFAGFDGLNRNLPGFLGKTPSNYEFNVAQSEKAFKSGWDVADTKSPLNSSFGVFHTNKFSFSNGKSLGFVLSLNADNSYTVIKGSDNTFDTNGTYNNKLFKTEFHYKTQISALLGLNFKADKFSLKSNTFFLRSSDNMIQDQVGAFSGLLENDKVVVRTNQVDESNYLNTQLLGDYNLSTNSTIKAGATFAVTTYKQPDRKFFKGAIVGDEVKVSFGGNNFIRQYLDINGNSFVAGFLEYNLKFGKDKANKLNVGYNGNSSLTETSYRFVKTNGNTNITGNINNLDVAIVNSLAAGNFTYQENSNASFKTKLSENTQAAFANILYKINDKLEISGGLRAENFTREIKYRFNGSFTDPFDKKKFTQTYILPALNIKYALKDNANLRFAASKNYTKPVSMEVIPIAYVNGDGTSVQGNPFLTNSNNINVDLKYEFFPTNAELLVIGGFYKSIENPIERTYRGEAGGKITTFLNSKAATIFGIELEGILDLKRINERLNKFSLGFNTSIMKTNVEVNPFTIDATSGNQILSAETFQTRELQGASKWLVNSDLKYQFNFTKEWTNTATLVYSVFGKRIFSVGAQGLDHIYELPFSQLDFVWNSKLNSNYSLKFGVNNILNPSRIQEQGTNNDKTKINFVADSNLISDYKKGVGFSLNLTYSF